MTVGNLNINTKPAYVSDPTTGRLQLNGFEMGDTGWRNLLESELLDGWTFDGGGRVSFRRLGSNLHLSIYNLRGTEATTARICMLPTGFRPADYYIVPVYGPNSYMTIHADGQLNAGASGPGATLGMGYVVHFTMPSETAWPTTLP